MSSLIDFFSSFRTWKHGLLLPGDTEQHVLRQFQLQPETSICLDVRTPAHIRHSSNFLHFQNFKGTLWFYESCLTLLCIYWDLRRFLFHQIDAWHSLEYGIYSPTIIIIIIILLFSLAIVRQRTLNNCSRTILMQGRTAVEVHWKAEMNKSVLRRDLNVPIKVASRVDELRLFQMVGAAKQEAASSSSWFPERNSEKMLSFWPQITWRYVVV